MKYSAYAIPPSNSAKGKRHGASAWRAVRSEPPENAPPGFAVAPARPALGAASGRGGQHDPARGVQAAGGNGVAAGRAAVRAARARGGADRVRHGDGAAGAFRAVG